MQKDQGSFSLQTTNGVGVLSLLRVYITIWNPQASYLRPLCDFYVALIAKHRYLPFCPVWERANFHTKKAFSRKDNKFVVGSKLLKPTENTLCPQSTGKV